MGTFLQIIGVIALIIIVAILAVVGPIIWRIYKTVRDFKKMAQGTISDAERMYAGPHEFVQVSPADFPGADLEAYEEATRQFEALGFRALGDIEDKTVNEIYPTMRSFIRAFSGSEGDISGGFFCLSSFKVFDLGTEFSDGIHLCVTNAESASGIDQPPEIMKRFCPAETPLAKLLELQLQSVRERLAAIPGLTVVKCLTLDDAIQSNHRAHAIQCRFRRERGGAITGEEIRRIAGDDREDAGEIFARAIEREKARGENKGD